MAVMADLFDQLGLKLVDSVVAPYARSFGFVPVGQPLVYINSLLNLSLALNLGNYAADHHIESGSGWTVRATKE
jgi:S-adenosylmethionine hydrolase